MRVYIINFKLIMSKTKKTEIPRYELLYIVPNKYTEDEVKPIIERVNKTIIEKGGKIISAEEWGKKKFAYPIKGFYHGYYNLVEVDLEGDKVAEIERALRLMNEILRHQVVSKAVKAAAVIEREKKIAAKIAAKTAQKKEMEIEKGKEKSKKKIDLGDLDEKLDKILETSDLL